MRGTENLSTSVHFSYVSSAPCNVTTFGCLVVASSSHSRVSRTSSECLFLPFFWRLSSSRAIPYQRPRQRTLPAQIRTMQGYKEPNLAILDPLANAIACASLYPCHERGIVDDTVEYFSGRTWDWGACLRRRATSRNGSLSRRHLRLIRRWESSLRVCMRQERQ